MQIEKITPILVVDAIEDVLPHWTTTLGFTAVATVPHGDALGFVILVNGAVTVMLQTRASLRADMPAAADVLCARDVLLYADVASIAAAQSALEGAEVLVPLRETFYGAREIWIRDASGNITGFSEHKAG